MTSRVAIIEVDKDVQATFNQALKSIGGIKDLNTPKRSAVVKVGIFNTHTGYCTTARTVDMIINAFNNAPEILIAESDSSTGPALKRLEIWKDAYNDKAVPFNLSDDKDTREVEVAGEKVLFSHVLFKPNVFVSTHVPRRYESAGSADLMNHGSILKNLLGLIPDRKKYRFHKQLPAALLDIYTAIGGIDLAVLDGTSVFLGRKKKRSKIPVNIILVGRDAIAVEAVGSYLVGFEPKKIPVLREAMKRGLGEADINNIEIMGDIETKKQKVAQSFRELFPKKVYKERR